MEHFLDVRTVQAPSTCVSKVDARSAEKDVRQLHDCLQLGGGADGSAFMPKNIELSYVTPSIPQNKDHKTRMEVHWVLQVSGAVEYRVHHAAAL